MSFMTNKSVLVGAVEEVLIPKGVVPASPQYVDLSGIYSPSTHASGLTLTVSETGGVITGVSIVSGGTGYAPGQLVLVSCGTLHLSWNGILQVSTITTGGVVASLLVVNAGTGYAAGPAYTVLLPQFAWELPHTFVIQDLSTVSNMPKTERISITGISYKTAAIAGYGYSVLLAAQLANSYVMPYASILTPGCPVSLQPFHFNTRMRALTNAPKITPDEESAQFATGDHRKDQSIMTTQEGEVGFDEKVAVSICKGSGLCVDITIDGNGSILTAVPHTAEAGTGYKVGDLVMVNDVAPAQGGDLLVTSITTGGAVASLSVVAPGVAYSTTSADTTAAVLLPQWYKFMRGMGHAVRFYGTTGVGFQSLAACDDVTLTLWKVDIQIGASPKAMAWMYAGCFGDGSLDGESTQAYKFKGKYQGKFTGTAEILSSDSIWPVLTGPDITTPEKMIANVCEVIAGGCPTIASAGTTTTGTVLQEKISKFSLAFGNKIAALPNQKDSTGHDYYCRTEAAPKLTINPLMKTKTEEDVIANVLAQQEVDVLIQSALFSPNLSIECPRGQVASPSPVDANGFIELGKVLGLHGNNLGAGPVQSALPDECAFEILIGSRS